MLAEVDVKKEVRDVMEKSFIDLVGFTAIPSEQKYPPLEVVEKAKTPMDIMPNAKSVIVFGKVVPDSRLDVWSVFSSRENDEYGALYGRLINASYAVILLLRSKGYEAQHYAAHYLKFFANKAGLGCFGKNNLIITPKFGPRIRLWGILTDAALKPDSPFNKDLCNGCSECLNVCPARALTEQGFDRKLCWDYVFSNRKWIMPGVYTWCSACLDACPIGATSREFCE